jgi:Flp pilus assembly protein TadG
MKNNREKPSRGQSLVETALALPILLMLLLGLVDFGRVYYVTVSLYDAAEEGAVYAASHPDDVEGIRRRAAEATSNLVTLAVDDVSPPVFEVAPPQPGTAVTIVVSHDFEFYTPFANLFFTDSTVTLRGEAVSAVIGGS